MSQTLGEILAGEGIRLVTGAEVRRVESEEGCPASMGAPLPSWAAAGLPPGRRPNTDAIAIERSGVILGPRGEGKVDMTLRTAVPHI